MNGSLGNFGQGGHFGQANDRNATHHVSVVFGGAEEEIRPVPQRHVLVGRRGLEVLALRVQRRRVF